MKSFALSLVLALPLSASASTIAVVDSGTDYNHRDLVSQYKLNDDEIAGNKIDDDKNGYVDDVYGYNLAEKSADVIDYTYLDRLKGSMPDIHKFFEVQVRLLDKTATDEDKAWMKTKRDDEAFIKQMGIFGNFAHGTHVAGITGGHSTSVDMNIRPFSVKIIPTEVKMPFSVLYASSKTFQSLVDTANLGLPSGLKMMGLEFGLRMLAKLQTNIFAEIGAYVHSRHADVMNGSFGTGYAQLRTITEMLYNFLYSEDERSKEDVDELTRGYMQQILINARKMPLSAPNTLFVFAAGNDGSNNDEFPSSPANLREDNTITVAATLRNRELASFSNYGASNVDVAAPGVGIHSLYPGDEHGLMSGTSQAAPYVANLAAIIKNENPGLKPIQVKEILMGTVDVKPWLMWKVKSSGFVNPNRAREAARLTNRMAVHEAINASRASVKDLIIEETPMQNPGGIVGVLGSDEEVSPMVAPLISPIN